MTHQVFWSGVSGFVFGIFLRSFYAFESFTVYVFLITSLIFIFFYFYLKEKEKFLLTVISFLLLLASGILWFHINDTKNESLSNSVNQEVEIISEVLGEPDIRDTHTKLVVSGGDSNILVLTEHAPRYSYGDTIKMAGILEVPQNFPPEENERFFDYVEFLNKDNIHFQFFYPEIELIKSDGGFFLKRWLFKFKDRFIENINRVIPEPHSSLLGGLVLGAKQSLGSDLLEDFRRTGLIHIVVLSGYNVTIVAVFIMALFSFLPKRYAVILGIVSIILFAIMVGGGPATVRASIMAILFLLSRFLGRAYNVTTALFVAGALMVLHNPKILVFDVGFQLSFIATLGLIHLFPVLEKYFLWVPEKFGLRELVVMTLSAQVSVTPWLLYKIGDLSLVALPVNLLVLAFIPLTMLFGFLTGVIGFVSTTLSYPLAWITYAFLHYELWIVEVFSNFSFASVTFKYFPLPLALLMYALLAWFVVKRTRRNHDTL